MKYRELKEALYSEAAGFDKVYERYIMPIRDPWNELDSIIDFVASWASRGPIERNRAKIKSAVFGVREQFEQLNNYNLEDFVFINGNKTIVMEIFGKLSKSILRFTATSKVMHAINPNLFVMWDKGISQHYGCYRNSEGYIHFQKFMQEEAKELLEETDKNAITEKFNRTLPTLINEYNWAKYRTYKIYRNYKIKRRSIKLPNFDPLF